LDFAGVLCFEARKAKKEYGNWLGLPFCIAAVFDLKGNNHRKRKA
jgi:hypothetical protein